jgi:hypothetical protein
MNKAINHIISELDNLVADIAEVDLLLSKIEEGNEIQIEANFLKLFQKYKCNPIVLCRFLTYLQINNSVSIDKYETSDIKLLFDKSCKIYNDMIELNLEKYFFYFNILDEENLALKELNSFVMNFNDSNEGKILKLESNISHSI